MKKSTMGFSIFGIALVIWLLGVTWHPFGNPTLLWHVIWVAVVLISGVYGLGARQSEKEAEVNKLAGE